MRAVVAVASLLIVLPLPLAHADGCGAGARQTSYALSSPLPEVPETLGRELKVQLSRTGDASCPAVAQVRLVGAALDFRSATNTTFRLAAGESSATAYFEVLDDRFAEPREVFRAVGDLRETVGGRPLDYPGLLSAEFAIQASDGYTPDQVPTLYFLDAGNLTVTRENQSWWPEVALTYPPASDTRVTLLLANGTCAQCAIEGAELLFPAGASLPEPGGRNRTVARAWSPDDNRTEAPQAACLRLGVPPLMRAGPARPWVVLDDDNRTLELGNRTALQAQGVANATIDAILDPCGAAQRLPVTKPTRSRTSSTSLPPSPPPAATTTTAAPKVAASAPHLADGGVPSDSPLLAKQESSAATLVPLLLGLLALARRRR